MADLRDIWSPAKVFSPSAAKVQSLQARDWSYVEQWLTTRYHPNPVPKFERNSETLKALLALAAANEAADEERALEKRAKEKALAELKKRDVEINQARVASDEPVFAGLEENLTPEGTTALNSIALLSVALGSETTGSQKLATHIIALSKEELSIKRQSARINALHEKLEKDLDHLRHVLHHLEHGEEYQPPPDLSSQVAEWTRTTRHLRHKDEDYKERVKALESEYRSSPISQGVTVPALVEQEQAILALKEHVLNLEAQAKGFQGLPPEKDLARFELERAEGELRDLEQQREKLYDNMIGG